MQQRARIVDLVDFREIIATFKNDRMRQDGARSVK